MQPNPVFAACIQRAAALTGGYEALGRRVDVAPAVLERWAHGDGFGAQLVFLKVIDVLQEEALRRAHSHSIVAGGLEEIS
jgi:hypothetical protein